MQEPTAKSENSDQDLSSPLGALERTFQSVLDVGKELLARRRIGIASAPLDSTTLLKMCSELLDHRGEPSGIALASEIIRGYDSLEEEAQEEFFIGLEADFEVDREAILTASERYREKGDRSALASIIRSTEAPRQKLFRRINMAPDGTRTLVSMRGDLLTHLRENPRLKSVDDDLRHLFISWFNKGFLELRRISWESPASVLERLIDYEAVHEINGWDDLRSRLRDDRRCFAFFHPALDDDPLVFVEIALTDEIPTAISPLLEQTREIESGARPTTVVFYSISNCHKGLAGVSFGNFLIKGVVEELARDMPWLKTFVTLSPVPGFRKWLLKADLSGIVDPEIVDTVKESVGSVITDEVYNAMLKLCAHYLLNVKSRDLPLDPVARFHLGNGALLHGLHGGADLSSRGREQSGGIMVNYLYDLGRIEINHEALFDEGKVAVSKVVSKLLD